MSHLGRYALILLIAAAAAACAPEPSGTGDAGIINAARRANGRWQFNSQKYGDTGAKPATGRSGSASLSAEALISHSGNVTLVVTSGSANHPGVPAGSLEKIQVKIFGADGRLLSSRNYNNSTGSSWSTPLFGVPAGGTVQVEANVKGIDGRRMDVVTVTGIVPALAPDLAVTGLVIPATAFTGTPTVLGATIAELGGQHGARANCVLYINGTEADRAGNIWVDAGDAVSCAFTHSFAAAGSATVRIALENVAGDGDLSNNAATGSVVIVTPDPNGPASMVDGQIITGTFTAADTFETTWTASDGSLFLRQSNGSATSGTQLSLFVNGFINSQVAFPLKRLELAENGDGRLLASLRLEDVAASFVGSGVSCLSRDQGDGSSLFLCSYDAGFSTVAFMHNAGVVTYQSTEYSKVWNGSSYDENTYVVNDVSSAGTFASVASLFSLTLHLDDGAMLYALNGSAAMAPTTFNDIEPRTCVTSTILVYSAATCFSSSYVFSGFLGAFSGSGVTSPSPAGPSVP